MSLQTLSGTVMEQRPESVIGALDRRLLGAILALSLIGLVMVASASVSLADRNLGSPFHYLQRQMIFFVLAYGLGWFAVSVRLEFWRVLSGIGLLISLLLLVLVLVPGVGREVNGSTRWIPMGPFNLQVAEVAKLGAMIYLAAWLSRHGDRVRHSMAGFLLPLAVLGIMGFLLLLQPDFGAAVVILGIGLGVLFLAGVPLWRFGLVMIVAVAAGAALIVTSPYRWERLTAFLNPWADPFNSGFQLTQSLIAIGRGEWFGVGLGASVQKLFYLPEAHTDFVFAVLAEEFGLLGVLLVLLLLAYISWRILAIGAACLRQDKTFAGYLCLGVGLWFSMQCLINIGVNMGLLPTKGLTLPLMSYGGSSLLMSVVALALVLRADYELRAAGARSARGGAEHD